MIKIGVLYLKKKYTCSRKKFCIRRICRNYRDIEN